MPQVIPTARRAFPDLAGHVAFWSTCAASVVILFSIAAKEWFLALGILAFLLSRQRARFPRVCLPLGLFLLGSMISLLASGEPSVGFPQVKKLWAYLILVLVFSVIKKVSTARNLLVSWCALAGIGSVLGIAQFIEVWQEARAEHKDFYHYYLGDQRITGFTSHWMTFSGEQMLVLVILAAFLLFGPSQKLWPIAGFAIAGSAMGMALLLTDTRSAWIATFAALLYLAWSRKKILVAAVPALVALGFLVAPQAITHRVSSIFHPQSNVDSNEFRFIVWRTGVRMIEAHPLLGLGPEEVHKQFYNWIPADIQRPLPPGYYGHLHSIYIHYAAERGIPTTLMLMWMLGMILWDCFQGLLKLPCSALGSADVKDVSFILHAGVACVIAILIEGFFELNLGDSEVLTMFLVITACIYVALGDMKFARREA